MQSVIQEVGITALGIANGKLTVSSTEVFKNRRVSETPLTNNLNTAITALHSNPTAMNWASNNAIALPATYPFAGINPEPAAVASLNITRTTTEFVLEFDIAALVSHMSEDIIEFLNMANQTMLNPEFDSLIDSGDDATNGGLYNLIGTVSIDQNKTVFLVANIVAS